MASAGCHVPVIPVIMPTTHSDRIRRFARFGNATVPDDLARRPEAARNAPGQAHRVGVAHATALARRLLDTEAPGLHYLTLNRPTAALAIHRSLSLPVRADGATRVDGASGTKDPRGTARPSGTPARPADPAPGRGVALFLLTIGVSPHRRSCPQDLPCFGHRRYGRRDRCHARCRVVLGAGPEERQGRAGGCVRGRRLV
ncbi:methylenetetrahydrofolate reductase [Streptomyces viridosporus]|uniref:methylenetetrahydrofolate reductase n=1 Tax=Streptomyces viridosporus TaxID=67581 RepID=UPI0036FA478C